MQTLQQLPDKPTIWKLFRIWASIGLQSFGGGASTTLLIQRAFIDRYGWLTMEEFAHLWNLCIFTPGINLVALTVLIGRKLGGARGIVASLAGMMVPSATITCLLAAGYKLIQHIPVVQAILRGVVPATGGIMFLVGVRFAEPLIKLAWKEGPLRLITTFFAIFTCAVVIILLKISVIPVLLTMALLGALAFTAWRSGGIPRVATGVSRDEKEDK
jgi:chromate transporter